MQEPKEVSLFREQLAAVHNGWITFKPSLRIVKGRKTKMFNDGPTITFDGGYTKLSLVWILYRIGQTKPTRAQLTKYLVEYGIEDTAGIYLLEAKDRRMVITTKSIAKSYAKVLWEMLSTDKVSPDLFTKRLAQATQVSFKVLYVGRTDYRIGARYAGIYDTQNPGLRLTESGYDYRAKFPFAYRKGLAEGGNFVSLAIERFLLNQERPVFLSPKEAKTWIESFEEMDVVDDQRFGRVLFQTIRNHSNE